MARVPKRDPTKPMALWHEELIGREGAHLFARNDGDVPMRITKVSVYECQNIDGGCVDYDPNLVLKPGEKQRLYTVVPLQKSKMYRFRWRASGGPERAPGGSAQTQPRSMDAPVPTSAPASVPASASRPPLAPSSAASTVESVAALTMPPPGMAVRLTAEENVPSTSIGNPIDTDGATISMSTAYARATSATSVVPPAKVRSRRMQLSGDIDARGVRGGVTLWIEAVTPGGNVTVESPRETRVSGTRKAQLAVAMLIPADATKVTLGVKHDGPGGVIVTALKLREK
jgi:hypothetical protein